MLIADFWYSQMDSRQLWTDFHFLNTTFRDLTSTSPSISTSWIQPSLVRFSARRNSSSQLRTVRVMDSLTAEYAAPFPLSFIFGPRAQVVYNGVFVLLLQIRRAKSVLERIMVRGSMEVLALASDMKVFYAMRGKLAWFVKYDSLTAILNMTQWLTVYITVPFSVSWPAMLVYCTESTLCWLIEP
jgi:gamma-tubulin complex component 5